MPFLFAGKPYTKHELKHECRDIGSFPVYTFKPTLEQLEDWTLFIRSIEDMKAHLAGVCKVILPEGCTRHNFPGDLKLRRPILRQEPQTIGVGTPKEDAIVPLHVLGKHFRKRLTLGEFQAGDLSCHGLRSPPGDDVSLATLPGWEAAYFRDIRRFAYATYAAGEELAPDPSLPFSLTSLNTILKHSSIRVSGIHTPTFYFGTLISTFLQMYIA